MPTELDNNLFSLGVIKPTPLSPLDIFVNYPDLAQYVGSPMVGNSILFQADPDNTGKAYVGGQHLDVATKTGIYYVLVSGGDSLSISSYALNVFELTMFRIDVDNLGDGVNVMIHLR